VQEEYNMSRRLGILAFVGALILVTADARAQGQGQTGRGAGTVPDERPATTTIMGDTGLWFVPTGEVLRNKTWSVSGYRANWDVHQGFTDISHFIGTFAVGVGGHTEIFGAVRFDTRIDRDIVPRLFLTTDPDRGGVVNDYPFVKQAWTGDHFGDTYIGAKVNFISQGQNDPVAFALRAMGKVPGDKGSGSSSGKADFGIDAILSGEVAKVAEISGTGGFYWRGDPSEINLANGIKYGIGAQFPSRAPLKFATEFWGEKYLSDTATLTTPGSLVAVDGSIAPTSSNIEAQNTLMFGATWQSSKGMFVGAGIDWSAKANKEDHGTKFGWQARIGYHPPIEATPLPAPPPPPPPPPPAPPEHTLTVRAAANPPTVEVGQTSKVTATPMDSINCALTYRWSAPTGTFANAAQQNTVWTAPNTVGSVPATVTATCPTDQKSASDTTTIQVIARPVQTFTFEDVYFDFDRYSLTDAAQRILSQAVETLRANPGLRIRIAGHTCSIGTAEYNLALGDRRARSVRDYLVSNGIAADRLTTVSFGEENPKFDNSREETRRLNRRAELTVAIVAGN
jgi:outer membrane protein OmpA-like peptidoglycan-associated protein